MKAEIIREPDFNAISLDGGKHWRYFVRDTRNNDNWFFVVEQEGHPEEAEATFTGYALPSYFHKAMTEEALVNADIDNSKLNFRWIESAADQGYLATVKPSDWPVKANQEVS